MKLMLKTELISGAGNTFHIAFGQAMPILQKANAPDIMKKITKDVCGKDAADGFIFLEQNANSTSDLKWYFFNNDGSDAEMCGNATRCVGLVMQNRFSEKKIVLDTTAGKINIFSAGADLFQVVMSKPEKLKSENYFYCDTGVPHLVIDFSHGDLFNSLDENFKLKSRELRFAKEFAPRGTNVTYVERTDDPQKIRAVSYERGVEGFTRACGTGAMAAAFENLTNHNITQTEVEMPGGKLTMNLTNINAPTMTGPAEKIGSYEYDIEI